MIRTYQGGDEAGFIAAWNQSMPVDGITPTIFVKRILADENFDPEGVFIAEDAGEVIGGLTAVVRKTPRSLADDPLDDGWITAFFVRPGHRRRHVGRQLLEAADHFFRQRRRRVITFSAYAPHYFVPGIDRQDYPAGARLLEQSGFKTLYQCAAMDKNLVGFRIPEPVLAHQRDREREGYYVERLTLPYMQATIALGVREFDPDWARAVRDAIQGSFPAVNILIARQGQAVVGFCLFGGYGHVQERFGPFGVAQSMRGTGLGSLLLYRALEQMQHSGLHNAWFLWTNEHDAAGHLYRRAGFVTTRRFDVMVKHLE